MPARSTLLAAFVVAIALAPLAVSGQPLRSETLGGNLVMPAHKPFDPSHVSALRVPDGFRIEVFAQGLANVRMLAIGGDGSVYVTQPRAGTVTRLLDSDGDGRADDARIVASGLPLVNGIAIRDGQVWLMQPTVLSRATIRADGTLDTPTAVLSGLPDGGQHGLSRSIEFGPDGALYAQIGSTCNACVETNPEHATLLRIDPVTLERTIHATGLRNLIGFDWHPVTRELWGMDHGTDWRGDDQPPEELNRIVAGGHYGWPYCFGDREPDRLFNQDPPGSTKDAFCPTTVAPVLRYQAHSAPLDFRFYTGTGFPGAFRNDAFATMHGSWNRRPATGYKVVRVAFRDGRPVGFEDFVTGFLVDNGNAHFGRPTGLGVMPDGALLFSDDSGGVIYRVAWTGSTTADRR